MARLTWSREATNSLRDIFDHIARDRPVTAFRTLESLINKVETLTTDPEKGVDYPHAREGGVRLIQYGQFQIAYHASSPERITVIAVFHGLIFLPLK